MFLDETIIRDERPIAKKRTRRATLAVQPPPGTLFPRTADLGRRRVSFFSGRHSPPRPSSTPQSPSKTAALFWHLKDDKTPPSKVGSVLGPWNDEDWREARRTVNLDERVASGTRYSPGLARMVEDEDDVLCVKEEEVRRSRETPRRKSFVQQCLEAVTAGGQEEGELTATLSPAKEKANR